MPSNLSSAEATPSKQRRRRTVGVDRAAGAQPAIAPETVVRIDELDDLIERYHQAVWHEMPNVAAMYADQIAQIGKDPALAERAALAFAYPFDKGIPRYRSSRWLTIRLGQYPLGDWVQAVNENVLRPSQLNHLQRRQIGFRMPKTALEYYGL